jgi:hypothetical protein
MLEQAAKWLEDRATLVDWPMGPDADDGERLNAAADAIRDEIKLVEAIG